MADPRTVARNAQDGLKYLTMPEIEEVLKNEI
jgi:hypothetical protein